MLDELIQAIQDVIFYNCLESKIERWISLLEEWKPEHEYDVFACPRITEPNNSNIYLHSDVQFLWMLVVLMFGDYGTSPRYGWVDAEHKEEALRFLKSLLKEEKEEWQES